MFVIIFLAQAPLCVVLLDVMAGSSWDEPTYPWEEAHDFGNADEAQGEFVNLLVALKTEGTLSATQACLLAFWATRGGFCFFLGGGDNHRV